MRDDRYGIIGAGPAGLAIARVFAKAGIAFDILEKHSAVGGIWDIANEGGPMYHSANFISSRDLSAYHGFPFPEGTAEYPRRDEVQSYLASYAEHFDLMRHVRFGTQVSSIEKAGAGGSERWDVHAVDGGIHRYKGLVLASGFQWVPNMPNFPGMDRFQGTCIHAIKYRKPDIFQDKRVLIVGFGASAVDIADEASRTASDVHMSIRSPAYVIPKHLFGVPTDVWANGSGSFPMPERAKKWLFRKLLHTLHGDLRRFGMPAPDHEILDKPPVLSSQLIPNLSHGRLKIKPHVREMHAGGVTFVDGQSGAYDVVVLCTGYRECWPYAAPDILLDASRESLFMNVFSPRHENLYVAGLLRSNRGGFWMFEVQGEMIASAIASSSAQRQRLRQMMCQPSAQGGSAPDYKSRYIDMRAYTTQWAKLKKKMSWPACGLLDPTAT